MLLPKYYKNRTTGDGPLTAQDIGYSYISPELAEQLDLEEVDASYQKPETADDAKQRKLQSLLDEYNADVQQLKERITAGMLTGGTAQTARVTAAQNEFATRKAKYAADRAAIINS